jgi:ligand-binding sensor domain-containing protein
MNRIISLLITIFLLFTAHCAFPQGIWKTYTRADGLAGDTVTTIIQDKLGNYWFANNDAGLSKLDTNGVWSTFMAPGDSTIVVSHIVIDSFNIKWLRVTQFSGHFDGGYVIKFDDSTFTYYSPTGHPEHQYEPHLLMLAVDAECHIWCGTTHALAYWFDGTVWHPNFVLGAEKYMSPIYQITTDRYGKLYFAHYRGISTLDEYIFDGGRYIGTMAYSIAFDRQNRMWFGCTHDQYALGMFDGQNWYGFSTANGLKENIVSWVAVDSCNNIWFKYGSSLGVTKFDGHTFTHFTKEDGLAHNNVSSIYVDIKGNIWFATKGGASVLRDTTKTDVEFKKDFYRPIAFSLFYNYPSPFNMTTLIKYDLIFSGQIELIIYNIAGKEVIRLINEHQPSGSYQVHWDGKDNHGKEVSSGIYIAVLKCDNLKKSIKLSLI